MRLQQDCPNCGSGLVIAAGYRRATGVE